MVRMRDQYTLLGGRELLEAIQHRVVWQYQSPGD